MIETYWMHNDVKTWPFLFFDVVDFATLRLSGIFDKIGRLPLNGDEICLERCSK